MQRASLWWVPALLCGVLVADAVAAPTGTVVLKDGRKWENVQFEFKNGRCYVTFPNGAGTDVPVDEVASSKAESAGAPAAGGDDADADPEAGPTTLDWEGRFRLEPPPGWSAVAPSSPLMRAQLRHEERDATLSVYIRQVSGAWDLTVKQLPKSVTDEVTADLTARYAKAGGARTVVGTLFDTPVLRVEGATVTDHGDTVARKLTELRFRRFGLEYSLSYVVLAKDEAALAPELPALFESFTFLPAVTHTPEHYGDYGRGFAIERANGDWTLTGGPFDPEQPVRLVTDGGRGELLVDVHAGTDAESVVRGIITRRKQTSRTLAEDRIETGDQGGTPVKRYSFEDYAGQGGRKKLLYKGFAALVGGKVVVFTGVHPVADDDARKLEGDLTKMLSGVRLWDADRIRGQLTRAQNAVALVSQASAAMAARRPQEALQKLDEAIGLAPQYARAFFLRAQAKKDAGDFKGQREDLELAAQLDPSQGYDGALALSYEAEAKAAETAKNWPEAFKLWLKVYRQARTEPNLRKVTQVAQSLYTDYKKDIKRLDSKLKSLKRDLTPVKSEAGIVQFLLTTYRDAAQTFMRAKEFRDAKAWAKEAKAIAPNDRARQEAEQLMTQIEQQAERERSQ